MTDHSGPAVGHTSDDIYDISTVRLDVQAYELLDSAPEVLVKEPRQDGAQEEEVPEARITMLPSKGFDGLWGSLVFEEDIPARLLRYLTKMSMHVVTKYDRLLTRHSVTGVQSKA